MNLKEELNKREICWIEEAGTVLIFGSECIQCNRSDTGYFFGTKFVSDENICAELDSLTPAYTVDFYKVLDELQEFEQGVLNSKISRDFEDTSHSLLVYKFFVKGNLVVLNVFYDKNVLNVRTVFLKSNLQRYNLKMPCISKVVNGKVPEEILGFLKDVAYCSRCNVVMESTDLFKCTERAKAYGITIDVVIRRERGLSLALFVSFEKANKMLLFGRNTSVNKYIQNIKSYVEGLIVSERVADESKRQTG
jgi:hypothetical protein